ncbi:MAG: ankyrin repeat domain-containing protein [Bacteroidetes bacterium]|nr:ankyrin repeat domain-containing protein [Bacteroidota bacterium]
MPVSAQPFSAPPTVKSSKLFDVIRTGDTKLLEQELANGASANDSLNSYSALMAATLSGTVEQMKLLIDHGANVNYQMSGGITALWLAVSDWEKTNLLLAHGADVQHRVENYGILTKVALTPGSVKILQLLIEKGADPKKSCDDNLLLYNAALSTDTAIIAVLLNYGLNVNDTTSFGDYPLNAALNYRGFEAMKMLIEHGANVDAQTKTSLPNLIGCTPLMFAAASNDKPSFYYLLEHGANPNLKSKRGYTAMMLLQQSENDDPDMTLALIKHGAKISVKAIDGTDALYYAKRKGNTKSVEILKQYANQ